MIHGMKRWESSWGGSRSVSQYFRFGELGIDLQFQVELHLKSNETEKQRRFRRLQYEGKIGVSSAFIDNTDDRLKLALQKKFKKLKNFKSSHPEKDYLPYIVIVFHPDSFDHSDELQKVLYGTSIGYDLTLELPYVDLRQWRQRANQELRSYSDGLFARYKNDLLAVLACDGYVPYPETCEMSMWLNPYASYFSTPQPLFRLKTYTLNRQIVCTPPI